MVKKIGAVFGAGGCGSWGGTARSGGAGGCQKAPKKMFLIRKNYYIIEMPIKYCTVSNFLDCFATLAMTVIARSEATKQSRIFGDRYNI